MTREHMQDRIAAWTRTARERGDAGRARAAMQADGELRAISWFAPAPTRDGPGHELVIILKTKGCSHYHSDPGGCTMCGYNNDSTGHVLDTPTIVRQFETAINAHVDDLDKHGPIVLKIFNSGSFFDEEEVPRDAGRSMFRQIASHDTITSVAVESRPEHVHGGAVESLKKELPSDVFFEVGIGLETWDDDIRNDLMNKGFTRDDFLQAHETLRDAGAGTKVYLFLKPPFLTEEDALNDVLRSTREVSKLEVSTLSINPATIHSNTVLERLWNNGHYRTPWLYTVRVLLDRVLSEQTTSANTLVLCDPVAGGKPRGPANCRDRECNESSLALIKQATGSRAAIPGLDPTRDPANECTCVLEWLDEMNW